jgi:hypothetical protein
LLRASKLLREDIAEFELFLWDFLWGEVQGDFKVLL